MILRFFFLTSLPDFFSSFLSTGIISKSVKTGNIAFHVIDLLSFCEDRDSYFSRGYGEDSLVIPNVIKGQIPEVKRLDDDPYGGGAGRIMRCEPAVRALRCIRAYCLANFIGEVATFAFSPRGEVLKQINVKKMKHIQNQILFCSRFEGVDERVLELEIDTQICIGDFVIMGGETAAQVLVEAVSRLVIINEDSLVNESFNEDLLEAPCYTRPEEFEGRFVPKVLLSGNHSEVEKFKDEESRRVTALLRPDLLRQR